MNYLPILIFIAGVLCGASLLAIGLYLGFRASYDIRNHREGWVNSDGLLKLKGDTGELDLLAEEDKKLDAEES